MTWVVDHYGWLVLAVAVVCVLAELATWRWP